MKDEEVEEKTEWIEIRNMQKEVKKKKSAISSLFVSFSFGWLLIDVITEPWMIG
jgi:hypothetical protein